MFELLATGPLLDELGSVLSSSREPTQILVSRQTLKNALARFLKGEFEVLSLVQWANTVELHDRIEYEPGYEKLIAGALFRIASPEINGSVTRDLCQGILEELARSASLS